MRASELLLLVRWADCAKSSDEFWRRLLVGSTFYSLSVQAGIVRLAEMMNE